MSDELYSFLLQQLRRSGDTEIVRIANAIPEKRLSAARRAAAELASRSPDPDIARTGRIMKMRDVSPTTEDLMRPYQKEAVAAMFLKMRFPTNDN